MWNAPENQPLAPASDWHALYTRHQHEKPIARILANKGHQVFLPLYVATHHWQDRDKRLQLPLFPCYVFICGGLDRQVQILRTPGVFSIVGWTGHPAIIPHRQIEAVRQMVQSDGHVAPYPFLNCGDRVRVRSGALQGLEGTLARKRNLFRLVVSLEMLGRSASVEIDSCCVERMGPAPSIAVSRRAVAC